MTCDSIGLFLETECRFPLESEDGCDYDQEEHESVPLYRRPQCGRTDVLVKKASSELIDLYRRFVSPGNLRLLLLLRFDLLRVVDRRIASSEDRSARFFPSSCACPYTDSIRLCFVKSASTSFYVDSGVSRCHPSSCDMPFPD